MPDADVAWRPAIRTLRYHNYEIALTSGARLLAADRGALNAGSDDLRAQAEIEQSGAATLSPLITAMPTRRRRASSSETLFACSVVVGLAACGYRPG